MTITRPPVSSGYAAADPATCQRKHREAWRVKMRNYGFPAFQGHVKRATNDSEIVCDPQHGGCGRSWRTTAKYVEMLPDYEPPEAPRFVCEECGRGDLPGNSLVTHPHGAYIDLYDNRWRNVYHERTCRSAAVTT